MRHYQTRGANEAESLSFNTQHGSSSSPDTQQVYSSSLPGAQQASFSDSPLDLSSRVIRHHQTSAFPTNAKFVPTSIIPVLVTAPVVRQELEIQPENTEAQEELVQWICGPAKRVFLTTVSLDMNPKDLLDVMEKFRRHGLSDESLATENICDHPRFKSVFTGGIWRGRKKHIFNGTRWEFLAPVFEKNVFRPPDMPADMTLPFLEYGKEHREGGFASVCQAVIHRDHHDYTPADVRPLNPKLVCSC